MSSLGRCGRVGGVEAGQGGGGGGVGLRLQAVRLGGARAYSNAPVTLVRLNTG